MNLKLTLPLPISINKLYVPKYSWNPKTKTRMPTGGLIMSKEGEWNKREIQKYAKQQLKKSEWDYEYTKDHYIYMDIVFYWNRAGRDDNNAFKLLHDSLQKIVYENDSKILTRTQRMFIDQNNPRIEIELSYVPYIGIFDNEIEMANFESVCKDCKRYGRNCSILKAAKEGRIQEDIIVEGDMHKCLKFK
jgi:Holliday junction resolvase RusA-like endonuclease